MNFRIVFDTIGTVLKIMGLMLLVPGVVALLYSETSGIVAFALTALLSICTGILLSRFGDKRIYWKQGGIRGSLLGLALWPLSLGLFPLCFRVLVLSMPYLSPISGFSATGATILVESNAQGYYIVNSTLVNNSISTFLLDRASIGLAELNIVLPYYEQPYILWSALLAVLPAAHRGPWHNPHGCSHFSPIARGRSPTFPGRDGRPEQGYDHAQSS